MAKEGLIIEDVFKLKSIQAPNQLNFLTWDRPEITTPGIIMIEKDGIKCWLEYDSAQFEPVVEVVTLSDQRLANVWGDQIYRLSLHAKKKQLSGKYRLVIRK